ncbi:MAG TPA: cytochrome c oxidase subunit II [Coleofasciculaceae cyanobacterium]
MLTLLEYLLLAILMAVNVAISRWLGQQAYSWMPPQATAEAQRVDALFSFLVAVGAFVLLGLVSVMLYSALFFRAPPEDFSEGHPMRGSAKIEIAWLVVPTLLVLWISVQNISIYEQLNILGLKQVVHLPLEEPANAATSNDTPKPAAEQIKVIAKQWVWSFRYPNNVISHELHLPVDQSTRLDMHSEDVIHGFYVPEFRLKQDIVPQRDIDLVVTPNRVGKYHLKDSQFSGADFALMVADVYVESRQAYQQWLVAAADQSVPNAPATTAQFSPKPLINSGWYTGVPSEPAVADRPAY